MAKDAIDIRIILSINWIDRNQINVLKSNGEHVDIMIEVEKLIIETISEKNLEKYQCVHHLLAIVLLKLIYCF